MRRLLALELAREIYRDDIPGLHDGAILDRAELGDRLAHRREHTLDILVRDGNRGPSHLDALEVAQLDLGPDVDRHRVTQRLARAESLVGIDVRGPDHGEPAGLDGLVERRLDETREHLALHLGAEHPLEHVARRTARPKAA